jgi:hypothetical protein
MNEHLEHPDGALVFAHACKMGIEGIVSKRLGSRYRRADYTVYSGGWDVGRIYETRTGLADLRWFCALYAPSKPGTLRKDSRAATLAQAKGEFEASWKQWKASAAMEEV